MADTCRGVIYVAFGPAAEREARKSIASLRKFHQWPIAIAAPCDLGMEGVESISVFRTHADDAKMARAVKTNLCQLATEEWEQILFLDADTRVRGDLSFGFKALSDGWEFVIVPSAIPPEGVRPMWHLSGQERNYTLEQVGNPWPLMLNTGVMFFRRTPRVEQFFSAWHQEWTRFRDKDQGALLRALRYYPVATLILGRPFNGGEVVEHLLRGQAAHL